MYKLLPAVLALVSQLSPSNAQITSAPPGNPPITYDALSSISSLPRNNITVYYTTTTVFGISTSINVGATLIVPTSVTAGPCPTNFFYPASAPFDECVYCPSQGFYSSANSLCATSQYLTAECAAGYFVAGTQTQGGTYLNSIDCLPSTVPVVPECANGYVSVSGYCVLPSILPTVRIDSYTTTTITYADGAASTLTYDDYTYVYASGVCFRFSSTTEFMLMS